MKRSGPPARRKTLSRGEKRLKADPDKTRAFVERARDKARERARAPLASPSAPVGAKRQRPGPVKFRPSRPARTEMCARCSTPGKPRRADDWHHWLPQQHIRVYVRGLRLSEDTSRAWLRRLLHDSRNLVALCRACHFDHEGKARRLSGEEVPHTAWTFALELGPEYVERLHRAYPGGIR